MRVLFVCGRGRLRSPTAAEVFDGVGGMETASAGVSSDADDPVTPELLDWAELVLVMEPIHRTKLTRRFGRRLAGKRVVVLGIADEHDFMAPALVEQLWKKVAAVVALPRDRPREVEGIESEDPHTK